MTIDAEDRRRASARERQQRSRARKKAGPLEFRRADASLFVRLDRLPQKAGVPRRLLAKVALKELTDNALDAAGSATIERRGSNIFVVSDAGSGISPARVRKLFNVARDLASTKLIRRPSRGALGNGLRVVVGAAVASAGFVLVESQRVAQLISADRVTGETIILCEESSAVTAGTRVTLHFGPGLLPLQDDVDQWARLAIALAGPSSTSELSSPSWYGESAFAELAESAQGSLADLAALFGIGRHALEQAKNLGLSSAEACDIDPDARPQARDLALLKRLAPPPPRLIEIAPAAFGDEHRMRRIEVELPDGSRVPALVQVWAAATDGEDECSLVVNRTPTYAPDLSLWAFRGESYLRTGGRRWLIGKLPKGQFAIVIAVTSPAMPITTDGKAADLSPFATTIAEMVGAAVRAAHKPKPRGAVTATDAAFAVMEAAYAKASANGTLPANARQIFYSARPLILEMTGRASLDSKQFTGTLLPRFLAENPATCEGWDIVFDARGSFQEPHSGSTIALGTISVRGYAGRKVLTRGGPLLAAAGGAYLADGPHDRYGAVLLIEKQGFDELLRAARIAERFDLSLMNTKGMSTTAARALVEHLSERGIPTLVAHDLDLAGLSIFGTLRTSNHRHQFNTPPAVHRLGLTIEQAERMNLQSEPQALRGSLPDVQKRLAGYGASPEEIELLTVQEQRIELNAMPADVFVRWLETELTAAGVRKVVPPAETLQAHARELLARHAIADRVAELEKAAREHAASATLPADLDKLIAAEIERDPALPWDRALDRTLRSQYQP